MRRGLRRVLSLSLGLVIGTGLVPAAASAGTSAPSLAWVMNSHAISELKAAGASGSLLDNAFGNGHSYVQGNPAPGSLGVPTVTYDSYADLAKAFSSGALPGHYRAVLLDLEDWPLTPAKEQVSPARYEQAAAALVHHHRVDGHRMLFITAPAVDIVKARCTCSSDAARKQYLDWDIAGGAARYADVFDIQAQNDEQNVSSYQSFVTQAARQARAANPHVTVLAGLSTDNGSQEVYGYELIKAYQAVQHATAGYWLNIPGRSPQCPQCRGPYPGPAVTLLRKIYAS